MKETVLVLGCTGSIGRATLEIIAHEKDRLQVFGLACKGNIDLLNAQIKAFNPAFICVYDEALREKVDFDQKKVLSGIEGMKEMAGMACDIVVNALPGSIGLEPTIAALRNKKKLALANKESLVMAGRIIRKLVQDTPEMLIPVDSEHSALHQLMQGFPRKELKNMIITASGGPFRNYSPDDLKKVDPEAALNHPTWKMGRKITLDSATLMNKGLEVIEARWLFDLEPSQIKVLIHPESIVHGMVELMDNSIMAYMSMPDMRIPIAYALNSKERLPLPVETLSLDKISTLSFFQPDTERFPSLRLAYEALAAGDSALIVLNTANEIVSEAFFAGKVSFTDIPCIVEDAIAAHKPVPQVENLDDLWYIHDEAKKCTDNLMKNRMR